MRFHHEDFRKRLADGYDAYVLTFMFQPLPPSARAAIMAGTIEAAYSRTVTRLVRYPNTAYNQARPFIWLGLPDYPVPKRRKHSLRDVVVNDGRHVHVVVLVPPFTRLKRPFDAFFELNYSMFLGGGVQRVHVEPLDRTVNHAVRYFAKSVSRGRIGVDDVIFLPRSLYELSPAQHPNNGRAGQVRRAPPLA